MTHSLISSCSSYSVSVSLCKIASLFGAFLLARRRVGRSKIADANMSESNVTPHARAVSSILGMSSTKSDRQRVEYSRLNFSERVM